MDSRTRDLCKRAKRADKSAACELLEIYHSEVFAYLRRLCGSRQDAEDLTQQTFLKVWSSLDGFAGRSEFSTWLYRIAHNTYIDWRRRTQSTAQNYPEPWWNECIDTSPSPSADAADRQMTERLCDAVDQLDDDKKHVVHLHYYQQLSIRKTAKILGIATSTVKYRLREVLRILKTRLDAEEDEPGVARMITAPKGETT